MPRWATEVLIAEVDFSNCRALIIDGPEFALTRRGSLDFAADGTPYIQTIEIGVKGLLYGVSLPNINADLVQEALTNIRATQAAGTPFRTRLVDALYVIDVWAKLDPSQRSFTHGTESEGMISDVVFRFISMALYDGP